MRLVNDHDEPYVALFSVQYAPRYSDRPSRPHDAAFKLKKDPKGREGVFIQPFSCDGIVPVAHVSHEVEAALALGWLSCRITVISLNFPAIVMVGKSVISAGATSA